MEWIIAVAGVLLAIGLALWATGGRQEDRIRLNARLATIERKLDLIMTAQGIEERAPELPDVIAELMQGRKIQAIKIYRVRTGATLADAKDAVERIAAERGLG